MSFLAEIIAAVLEWLLSRIGSFAEVAIKRGQADQVIKDQAKADGQKLKDAKTDEEKDLALKSTIDHSFGD